MVEVPPMAMKFLRQRVSLRHLRLVLVLDEERSITKTAERLCISQAAVSKTRSEIEKGRAMYEQLWNQVLAEGVETAIFDPRLVNPLVAKGILGMFNYSYLWYDVHGSLTPEQIADQFTDVLLHGILPEQAQHPVPSGAGAGAQRVAHVD